MTWTIDRTEGGDDETHLADRLTFTFTFAVYQQVASHRSDLVFFFFFLISLSLFFFFLQLRAIDDIISD